MYGSSIVPVGSGINLSLLLRVASALLEGGKGMLRSTAGAASGGLTGFSLGRPLPRPLPAAAPLPREGGTGGSVPVRPSDELLASPAG